MSTEGAAANAKVHERISIQAPRVKVWQLAIAPDSFAVWSAAFAQGSCYIGTWDLGETLRFVSPGEDGASCGLLSKIVEHRPPEFTSIQHYGGIKNGVEETVSSDKITHENYTLTEEDGATVFTVDMEVWPEYEASLRAAWPKALQKLKEICEAAA